MKTKIIQNIKSIILALILTIGVSYVFAAGTWSNPPAGTPPNCPPGYAGCDTPLNVGSISQTKTAGLWLKGLNAAGAVLTNSLIVENGKVGLGTTSPSGFGKLTVETTPSSPIYYWDTTQATFRDNRAMATGRGGGISLAGNYLTAGGEAQAAGIQARKTNSTSGDPTFGLDVWSRSGAINFTQSSNVTNTPQMTIAVGGNVGIGTTVPTAKLDVNGTLRVRGGTPGAGKVLVSDANGNSSWKTPTITNRDGIVPLATVRDLVRADAGYLTQEVYYDDLTANKVCQLAGYVSKVSVGQASWRSPSDNTAAYWNGSAWIQNEGSRSGWMNSLTCGPSGATITFI